MYEHAQSRPSFFLPSLSFGGAGYDSGQLYVIPLIALMTTLVVIIEPSWFVPVLVADLWLLGYHHVIATYTRTAFDREMFRRHWQLMVLLPPVILLAVIGIAQAGGALAITTIYIHWQLFHYVRQSEGISKAFASRQGDRTFPNRRSVRAAFYLLPAAAFLTMASHGPTSFLGFPVWVPVLPTSVLATIWAGTAVALVLAMLEFGRAARSSGISRQYLHYYISHVLVFFIAYALIADVMLSWLMANIWHNSQYLAFVWKANQQRFKSGVSPSAPVLSTLSLTRNLWLYVTVCLTLTVLVYFAASRIHNPLGALTGLDSLAIAAVVYQTINFHHYVVDAIIWRRPRSVTAPTV